MNSYTQYAQELAGRIAVLRDRAARWSKHPTLHTRVAGVEAEIASLERTMRANEKTGRWADELNRTRPV